MDDMLILIVSTFAATLRVATPLIFCAMAGLFSERSGIIDIGLEGKMLAGAFAAASMAAWSQSAWAGLGAGILVALLFALIHGFACITHRGDQVVSGVAINIIASGLTIVLGIAWFQRGGQTPDLSDTARFMPLWGGQSLLTYLALASVPAAWFVLYRTRFGLRLRAVGEAPGVVDTAGVSVAWLRYRAVMIAGLLCGLAGTYLAISQNASFSRDMTAGRGYIALAAMIFGLWRPWPAFFACLLFGLLDAVSIRLQGIALPLIGEVPVQWIQALPYALTVILLAGFVGRAIAPKAIGQPYSKER